MNRLINKTFRKHGLSVRPDAAREIKAFLEHMKEVEDNRSSQELLENLVSTAKQHGLETSIVDLAAIKSTLELIAKGDSMGQEHKEVLQYVSAFDTPRYRLDPVRNTLHRVETSSTLHGSAEDKALMLRDRWQILHQRILRNDIFAAPAVSAGNPDSQAQYKITHIEALIGRPGRKCIFGMLTQLVEDKWSIEDAASSVEIDLTDVQVTTGLFVENCMVLAEGELIDGIFYVSTLGFPPSETRAETLKAFPQLDCLGQDFGGREKEKEKAEQLRILSTDGENDMIIILSEVHLDKPRVMEKLEDMFRGYEAAGNDEDGKHPPLFVLMGNFMSTEMGCGAEDVPAIRAYFDQLSDLIMSFPELAQNSKFLLIPGPTDLSLGGKVLPSPPMASIFTKKLKDSLGDNLILGTNPSRILYCTKELVFFRHDLLHLLRRNCVVKPSEADTAEISEHLIHTLLDQAHLCPLPSHKMPVYWQHDHALRLYPVPDALIVADCVDQFQWNYEGSECVNPGPFSVDFSFVVYWPARTENQMEFSRIKDKKPDDFMSPE